MKQDLSLVFFFLNKLNFKNIRGKKGHQHNLAFSTNFFKLLSYSQKPITKAERPVLFIARGYNIFICRIKKQSAWPQ